MVFKKGVKRCCGLVLVLSIISFHLFVDYSDVSAINGKFHLSIPWNDYVWIYTANGASTWGLNPNLEGTPFYDGVDPINGFTFNASLDWIPDQYGNSTSGFVDFTLEGAGNWGVDGGDLTNAVCEVWTNGGQSKISSYMSIIKSYYSTPVGHAVDYRCEFEAVNKIPAYVYIRVGTNSNNDPSIIPIMSNYLISGVRTQPRIRNASYTYNTSSEGIIAGDVSNIDKNLEEHYNKEEQAIDNIENQSSSDIPDATNQQTTNLIGIIQGFLSALQNFNTGSCSLTLPFPNFVIGDVTVNPCSYKEKAPSIVTVGSSLALIGFFIPLAWLLLRLIYKEIRSWTNG